MRLRTLAMPVLALASLNLAWAEPPESPESQPNISVHKTNAVDAGAPVAGGTTSLTPITAHGGPVMTGTITAYVIWYGNWNQANNSDTPAGQQIVRDFLSSVGNSPYFTINTTYTGVSGGVVRGAEYADTGSQGTRLSDAKVQLVVSNAIAHGLPKDTNGVYFVLTSSNVSESSGFCTRYCGWHTFGTISGSNIKYSFVGNASRCLSACAAQTVGPNGNAGVDGMLSVIAHELEEAASDPQLNAWYDSAGSENADKCAWTFGSTMVLGANGAYYNMTLGGKNYLIQRNLDATNSKCYVSYKGAQ